MVLEYESQHLPWKSPSYVDKYTSTMVRTWVGKNPHLTCFSWCLSRGLHSSCSKVRCDERLGRYPRFHENWAVEKKTRASFDLYRNSSINVEILKHDIPIIFTINIDSYITYPYIILCSCYNSPCETLQFFRPQASYNWRVFNDMVHLYRSYVIPIIPSGYLT
jgi:hypothetical protein